MSAGPFLGFVQISNSGTGGTVTIVTESSGSGSIGANAKSIQIIFNSGFTGTIGGSSFTSSNAPITINAPAGGVLNAINFTVSAGSVTFITVT